MPFTCYFCEIFRAKDLITNVNKEGDNEQPIDRKQLKIKFKKIKLNNKTVLFIWGNLS